MLADLVFFMFAAFLAIPTIGAYFAHSRGRNFWLWFVIGACLPVISYIILLLLPDKKEPIDLELERLRIDLGLLGTSPDVPLNDPLRSKILKGPIRAIDFQSVKNPNDMTKRLAILIDGQPLIELIKQVERPFSKKDLIEIQPGAYQGLPLTLAMSPSEHFLGIAAPNYEGPKNRVILLVDKTSGKAETWALSVEIKMYRRHVVWCNFKHLQRPYAWRYHRMGIFVFNKMQYLDALHSLTKVN